MSRARPPYPPRPVPRGGAEPSLDWRVRLAVGLLGARRVMTPALRQRLELTGLRWEEIAPLLARIRSVDGWARVFAQAADASEAGGDWHRASALAFLGQLIISPHDGRKEGLQAQMRRAHIRDRQGRRGVHFEVLTSTSGLSAYRETPVRPDTQTRPVVVLMPPLASTKEELTLLADPLLTQGFSVIRLDLPGQGQSPPPLPIHAEREVGAALDEWGVRPERGVIAGGISLGAYFALRLAGSDRGRVRGAFGISPPAILTPDQWAKQEEVVWQYLDLYFATGSRAETLQRGMAMQLDDVVADITCPTLLYHARRDTLSLPNAPALYRKALHAARLEEHSVDDTHGCLLFLRETIAPHVARWCREVTDG